MGRQTFDTVDVLRLEVEDTPAGIYNLIQNPDGELGGWGWITPVAGSILRAAPLFGAPALRYIDTAVNAGGQFFYSENIAITAGQYAAARLEGFLPATPAINVGYRVRIDWLTAAGADNGATAWSTYNYGASSFVTGNVAATVAPASTAFMRLRIEISEAATAVPPSYPYTGFGNGVQRFRHIVLAKAATSGALASLPILEPFTYTNILGPTHEITIARDELEAGLLTATILDAALDPSQDDMLRPGRRVRVRALNPTTSAWDTLFFGKARNAKVDYDYKNPGLPDAKRAKIVLTAVDDVAQLAATPRDDGVATITDLTYLMEGAAIPWNVNGSGDQVSTATIVATNPNATLLDQIAITRDSVHGYAWVSRSGVLNAHDAAWMPTGGQNQLTDPSFEAGVSSWSTTGGASRTQYSSFPPHSGTYSMRVVWPTVGARGAAATRALSGLIVGATYTFDAWVLVPGDGSPHVVLRCGSVLSSPSTVTDVWQRLRLSFVAASTTATIEVVNNTATTSGKLVLVDDTSITTAAAIWDEDDYSDASIDYDTERCINTITIKYLRKNLATGETVEVPYGPYTKADSVKLWGTRSAEFTIQGIAETELNMAAYANAVFAANATPTLRVNSVTLPTLTPAGVSKALRDLYDLVTVQNAAAGIDVDQRITGVQHTITADNSGGKWLTTYSFGADGGVAPPLQTPPPGVAAGAPFPEGAVLSGAGPLGTAVPGPTSGSAFNCRAGVLRGIVSTTAFSTVTNSGIQVLWYLDGVPVCYTQLSPAHVASAHSALSMGVFSITVTAGTHYLYGQLTLGNSDFNDVWAFSAQVTPT